MTDVPATLERECAVAVLAGCQVCPRYGMPCWVCLALHIMTGTIRSVVAGRFDRFNRRFDLSLGPSTTLDSPHLVCPHHAGAQTDDYLLRYGGAFDDQRLREASLYWATEEASVVPL